MFMLDIVWKVAHHVTAWKLWRSGMTRSGFPIRPPTQPGQRKRPAPSQAHTFANCHQSVPKARGWMPLTKEMWTAGLAYFILPAERVALLMNIYKRQSLPFGQERDGKELLVHILIECDLGHWYTRTLIQKIWLSRFQSTYFSLEIRSRYTIYSFFLQFRLGPKCRTAPTRV